jgi:hypothetical protein
MSIANLKTENSLNIFSKTFTTVNLNSDNLDLNNSSIQNLTARIITTQSCDAPRYITTENNIVSENINIAWSKAISSINIPSLQINQYNNLTNINQIDYIGSNIQNCKAGNQYLIKCSYIYDITGSGNINILGCFGVGPTQINTTIGVLQSNNTPYKGYFEYYISIGGYTPSTGALFINYSFNSSYTSAVNVNDKSYNSFVSITNINANIETVNGIVPFTGGVKVLSATGTAVASVTRVTSYIIQEC